MFNRHVNSLQYFKPATKLAKVLFTCAAALILVSCSDKSLTPCDTAKAICENFDNTTQIPTGWHTNSASNVKVSQEQFFSSPNSLKVTAQGGGYNRSFLSYDLKQKSALQKHMFGRIMIFLKNKNENSGDFVYLQAEGKSTKSSGAPAGTKVMYRGRIDGQYDSLMANYDTRLDNNNDGNTDHLTDCWNHPNSKQNTDYQIPHNEWACLQWHFDTQNNSLSFWLNRKALTEINTQDTGDGCLNNNSQGGIWTAPKLFETLHLGIEQYHNTALARELFIDDIVISTSPVECL